MKQKVAIIGHHAFLHPQNDGQTVKTQQLTKALKGWLGVKSIKELDTQGILDDGLYSYGDYIKFVIIARI